MMTAFKASLFSFDKCLQTRRFREAYTGLPVVRVTEKQKALNCVILNCSIPVYYFKSGVINTI